jgi:hypothetical protein
MFTISFSGIELSGILRLPFEINQPQICRRTAQIYILMHNSGEYTAITAVLWRGLFDQVGQVPDTEM